VKPKSVFIQLPQGPLLIVAVILKKVLKYKLIADVHTAFLFHTSLKVSILNKPFVHCLKFCDLIIVHNDEIRREFIKDENLRRKTVVIQDPLIEFKGEKRIGRKESIKFIFPASFSPDEPIESVITAFSELIREGHNCILYITGNWKRKKHLRKYASKNIIFTGFLSKSDYESILASSDVIIALTTREYTFLSAAAEGLAAEKPLILSKTKTLRRIFKKGAIFVSPRDVGDIKKALRLMLNEDIRQKLMTEIKELKKEYIIKLSKRLDVIRNIL